MPVQINAQDLVAHVGTAPSTSWFTELKAEECRTDAPVALRFTRYYYNSIESYTRIIQACVLNADAAI